MTSHEQVQFDSESAGKRQRTQYIDLDGRIAKLEKGGSSFPSVNVGGANSVFSAGGDRQGFNVHNGYLSSE